MKPSFMPMRQLRLENAFETIEIDQETIEVVHRVDQNDVEINLQKPRVSTSFITLQLEPRFE